MLVRSDLECHLIPEFSFMSDNCEVLSLRYNRTIFSVFYRPPNGDASEFINCLDGLLQYVNENNYTIYCGGDFNIDMLGDSALRFDFDVTVSSNACAHVITLPTRVTQVSATLLDTFVTNIELSLTKSGWCCFL